jgi:hypothetical protein
LVRKLVVCELERLQVELWIPLELLVILLGVPLDWLWVRLHWIVHVNELQGLEVVVLAFIERRWDKSTVQDKEFLENETENESLQ